MESRQVCCCGARIWCLVIGYLTLIVFSVRIVGCLSGLLELSNGIGPERAGEVELQSNFSSIYGTGDSIAIYLERIAFQSVIVSTVVSLYEIIHGAILCVGVHLEKRIYLTIWLVMEIPLILYAGIFLLLGMVASVLAVFALAPIYLLLLLPVLAFLCFLLVFHPWVVKIHWNELKV